MLQDQLTDEFSQNWEFGDQLGLGDQLASSHELRKKTKEIHKLLSDRSQKLHQDARKGRNHKSGLDESRRLRERDDVLAGGDNASARLTQKSEFDDDIVSTKHRSKSGSRDKTENVDCESKRERERQFKQMTFKPNYHKLTGTETCGVNICKKLFGITIFEYSNGKSRLNNMTKDRKLVVQGVTEGAESQGTRKIHRGETLET